jgi:hypothetical protein
MIKVCRRKVDMTPEKRHIDNHISKAPTYLGKCQQFHRIA